MLRNKKALRIIAIFLIFNTLYSVFIPTISFALTTGPSQIEYTSYETPGTTDMVNLLTGDFTTSLPILEVPGPEGGFSLPLSYHGSIGLEQESSWVGLGFSLNPGAICRNVVQYPDDSKGEELKVHRVDPDVARGWNASLLGFGNIGWNSMVGHNGTIDLLSLVGGSYQSGNVTDVGVVGVHFNDNGVKVDPVGVMMAASTLMSWGASGIYTSSAKAAMTSIAKQTVIGIATNAATTAAFGGTQASSFNFGSNWKLDKQTKKKWLGIHKDWWYRLDATRIENMYGSLYLGKMPTPSRVSDAASNYPNYNTPFVKNDVTNELESPLLYMAPNATSNAASDMVMSWDGKSYYDYNKIDYTSVAKDDFSVMGIGISGSIEPYRLDVGSLAMPRDMTPDHLRLAISPYKDYKVPFVYEGSIGNNYLHHLGLNSSGNYDINNPIYGVNHSITDKWVSANFTDHFLNYLVTDDVLKNNKIQNERKGLKNNKLAQGKYIEWFTNAEILSGDAKNKGFIEVSSNPRCSSCSNSFRIGLPSEGIGAIAITREDGTTFHYSLPVYNWRQMTYVGLISDKNKNTKISQLQPYATSWLLTAITGPDFIDRGGTNGISNGIIDESDWGYWTKFDYGRFAQQYKWRYPYLLNSVLPDDPTMETYSEGIKELYYLNSITTRTHTALFIKDLKEDGKGHYSLKNEVNMDLQIADKFPSNSLKLDEIILLDNKDYKKLITRNGISSGSRALTIYNDEDESDSDLKNLDSYESILDGYDIYDNRLGAGDNTLRNFINTNALKRIIFNYTYELCRNTTNSFGSVDSPPSVNESDMYNGRGGKLTLKSVSMYGPENVKLMPDYLFEYGVNPNYHADKWDGWGLYDSRGNRSVTSHHTFGGPNDGNAWSLSRIVTPLGSSMTINYERDDYASVCGETLEGKVFTHHYNSNTKRLFFNIENADFNLTEVLHNGQKITLYSNLSQGPLEFTISDLMNDSFVITEGPGSTFPIPIIIGYITFPFSQRKGGNLRVHSLVVTDENNVKSKTNYIYTQNGSASGVSSGIVSQEPIYTRFKDYDFYNLHDLPSTPVLYSKVSVLNLNGFNNITSKKEFEFETPKASMVSANTNVEFSGEIINNNNLTNLVIEFLTKVHFKVDINTAKIGAVKSIKNFNGKGNLLSYSNFEYTSDLPSNQGRYSEGSLLIEKLKFPNNRNGYHSYHRFFRTTKIDHPFVLSRVVTASGNLRSVSEDKDWDFYTGMPLTNEQINSLDIKYVSTSLPAYQIAKYSGMGSKVDNPNNKNMLTQEAASYTYKIQGSNKKLIGAGIQTWNDAWNTYRAYNTATDTYEDQAAGPGVWRLHENYVWKSTELNSDGTYKNFVDFDWTKANLSDQDAHWIKTSELKRFDHFSMPLEAQDINGNFASTKMGHNQSLNLASATNAKYTEMAYSGAEDKASAGSLYFSGEVKGGDKQTSAKAHTGKYSILLTNGETGFTYKVKAGSEAETNRDYRASVWVHTSDLTQAGGALYASLSDGTSLGEMTISHSTVKKAGEWHLLNLYFTLSASAEGKTLTLGCKNTKTQGVYFDDFRFHPVDGPMATYVYDDHTHAVTHILDNDNLYTAYEYDKAGRIIKTYQEVFDGVNPKKLVGETQYNFARYFQDAMHQVDFNIQVIPVNSETSQVNFTPISINPSYPPSNYTLFLQPQGTHSNGSGQFSVNFPNGGNYSVKIRVYYDHGKKYRDITKGFYIP